MQTIKPPFTESEQHIGYIETDSGTLLLADGIWCSSMPSVDQQALVVDTEIERTKFPVYAIMRGGQRFLLIALDTNTVNTPITTENDHVDVYEPLSDDELATRKSEEES
jgi:hypothetical protein